MFRKYNLLYLLMWLLVGGLVTACGDDDDDDNDPMAPTADAGADQTVGIGSVVTLDGTASTAASGRSLSDYEWEITDRPSGSTADVVSSSLPVTTFSPDEEGDYTIRLTVTDDEGDTDDDEVTITVDASATTFPIIVDANISSNTTWQKVAPPGQVDYLVTGLFSIDARLTIEQGVRVAFESNAGLQVRSNGSIVAVGTANEKITFVGETASRGFWRGIRILSNNPVNELTHVVIRHGGSSGFDGANEKSNLEVDDLGRVKITNSEFSDADGPALRLRDSRAILADFANNVFTDSEVPVVAAAIHYHFFDAASDFTGNDDDYIFSYNGTDPDDDVTWQAINVPYRLAEAIESIDGEVTIQAGARFIGGPGAGLQIRSNGSIVAVGTANEKITFVGETASRGFWRGIRILSNNPVNELTHVIIRHGGSSGFDGANEKSNLEVDDLGRVKITNSEFSDADGPALRLRDSRAILADFANNVFTDSEVPVVAAAIHYHFFDAASDFTGNDDDYILSYNGTDPDDDVTWQALSVPYRLAEAVESIDGAVTIQPGARFIGGPGAGLQVRSNGSLNAEGTSANPITFLGEQDVSGFWRGLRFLSNNPNNVLTNVEVANGGSAGFDGANRKANVELGSAGRLTVTNSTIRTSDGWGIFVQGNGDLTESGNTFSGNDSGNVGP